MTKAIIFDSSTLISFVMNGLFPELRELKKIFGGHFIITREVKEEIIDKPITIKRFAFEALRANQLILDGIIEFPSVFGIKDEDISKKTKEVFDLANETFSGKKKSIHLIDLGECSVLALSELLNQKNIPNILAVDERTTRSLIEDPEGLRRFLEKRLHTIITPRKQNYKFFGQFKIIRSSELIYIGYKKNILRINTPNALDAIFWALKFRGCAISEEEIADLENLK